MQKFCGPKNDYLLIPITLNAMVVGESPVPTIFKSINNNYARLINNSIGEYVASGLMDKKQIEKPGIHLHWILPDSLTQGVQDNDVNDEEINYPTVPNRWVITRLWTSSNKNDEIQSKSWIIESDVFQRKCDERYDNIDSLTWPYLTDLKQPYRFIGRNYVLGDKVSIINDKLDKLTAVAPGNPYYAALYPYCKNVFGFYDDLIDENNKIIINKNITYTVCGYYLNSNDEILNNIDDANECMSKLKWQYLCEENFPTKSMLHGMVCDINWIDEKQNYSKEVMDNLKIPKLAIGNNSAEAIAALQANRKNDEIKERLYQLFANEQYENVKKYNGIKNSEYKLHSHRFEYKDSDNFISVENTKDSDKTKGSLTQCYMLNDTNDLKKKIEKEQRECKKDVSDIYDLWYKYMLKSYVDMPWEEDAAKKLMHEYELSINELERKLMDRRKIINADQKLLKQKTDDFKESIKNTYNLIYKGSQRYYAPNNPVLLFSEISRNYSYGEDDRFSEDDFLKCRGESQLIESFSFNLKKDNLQTVVTIDADDFDLQDLGDYCPEIIGEIIKESVLLSLSFSENIAYMLFSKIGVVRPSKEEIDNLTKQVEKKQTEPYSKYLKETYICDKQNTLYEDDKFPEKLAVNYYVYPWLPLYFTWRATYYPDKNLLLEKPNLDNWKLESEDYLYIGEELSTKDSVSLEGQILLTPHAAHQLSYLADKIIDDSKESKAEIVQKLANLKMLSQELNGFNEFFIMREVSIEMPIFDFNDGNQKLADKVNSIVGDDIIERPIFNSFFSPIRGGYLKFDRIQIVDSFGQFQEIEPEGLAVTEDFRKDEEVYNQYIMLPPRFIQNSRLNFQWISSRTNRDCEMDLGDSPICGFVLANHIDQSMMVYDDDGIMLGSLYVSGFDGGSVRWRQAPSNEGLKPDEDGGIPKDMNIDLYNFLNEIYRLSKEEHINVLTDLLKCIDDSMWNINTSNQQEERGLSLLIGRPIALAKSTLKLEQELKKEDFHVLEKNSRRKVDIPKVNIDNFELPVYLGEEVHQNDGLVGFFITDGKVDYSEFYNCSSEREFASSYFVNSNEINIPMKSINSISFTMLIDPLAGTHIKSAMLPVKYVQISNDIVNNALKNLYFTIFNASFLSNIDDVRMPFPMINHRNWSFMLAEGNNKWHEYKTVEQSNGNAFLSQDPQSIIEGYMKMNVDEEV